MATATSSPPAPIAIIPSAPLVVVCESAPTRMPPGPGEALDVHVVADAVAGPREMDPVAPAERLEHAVVVGVLVVELDDVVVHVLDGALDLDARHVQLLELHERHRAGGVLEERLVHAQRDRRAGPQLALHEVVGEDLAREVLCHRPMDCYPVAIGCAPVAERRRQHPVVRAPPRELRAVEGRGLVLPERGDAGGPRAAAAHGRPGEQRDRPAGRAARDRRGEERRAAAHPARLPRGRRPDRPDRLEGGRREAPGLAPQPAREPARVLPGAARPVRATTWPARPRARSASGSGRRRWTTTPGTPTTSGGRALGRSPWWCSSGRR